VVLLVRGVMAGALVTPGEGEVDALDRDKEFLEEVEDGELESCRFLMTSCILSPWRKADPVLARVNCRTPPLLILTVK